MASRADEYRRRAQECLELAATFKDREARCSLAYMAQVWLRLADHDEGQQGIGILKVPEEAQPAVQQQQQIQPENGDP